MRITYIHQHFKLPTEGGGGRPYQFARRLVAEGHTVTMIAGGAANSRYEVDGIEVRQVSSRYDNSQGWARRIYAFAAFMVRAARVSASVQADVVFASSTPLTAAIPGILASAKQRAPFVFEVRDLWPRVPIALGYLPRWLHAPARQMERFAYRQASEIIALSPWMEAGVKDVLPNASTHMIPNCSDLDLVARDDRAAYRESFGFHDDEFVFYYGGSLGVGYDPEWLADFAIRTNREGVRVVIAGDGAGRELIAQRLSEEGLAPSSVLLGKLPRSRLLELAVASDVALSTLIDVPELMHNSLNKVFDALAVGTPVVFNHGGWLCDIVTGAGAGWLVPRHWTQTELRDFLARIEPDEALRNAGERARSLATQRFDRDRLFKQFHGVLKRAADERSAG